MSISPALLAAARDAAPILARLRAAQEPAPAPEPTASTREIALLYLGTHPRPHGLLKQICLDHDVEYHAVAMQISKLRKRQRVL